MLDVPDEVLDERRTYADYIRYLAIRGEYGLDVDPEAQLRHFQERVREHYAFERSRPDGTIIEVRHNPVHDGGFVLIFTDITERKRSEAEIRAARDAAEAAYRDLKAAQANLIQAEKMASLGQLTAGIAHEIKNPLNFVNNFAELSGDLLDELHDAVATNQQEEIDELTATLKGNLAKIAEHGRRADGIVRSMLEHSRGSSGERRSVDLNTLVDEALNLAYHGARAQDQSFNITLQRDFDVGIMPITLVPQDSMRRADAKAWRRRPVSSPRSGLRHENWATPWRSECATTASASLRRSGTSCSSRSSPPSRPVRALVLAYRSATTL
jgi:signal transduction histidine kinase